MPVDQNPTEEMSADRAVWTRPEIRRVDAGDAEGGANPAADGINMS